jgi:hypothetical protein
VTPAEQQWRDEVRAAALAGDRDALGRLFAQAHELFGEGAEHKWSEAMSALDAGAQTG